MATMGGVAVLAHEVFGLPWASAFVLEGEALVNDATALVAYKIAVAVAVGEGFSASHAGLEFLGVAAGGIAVGLLVGYLLAEIRKRLDDPATEATMSLFSGYAAFLPADRSAAPASWRRSAAASTSAAGTGGRWGRAARGVARQPDHRPGGTRADRGALGG
jgi:hypothetical protein